MSERVFFRLNNQYLEHICSSDLLQINVKNIVQKYWYNVRKSSHDENTIVAYLFEAKLGQKGAKFNSKKPHKFPTLCIKLRSSDVYENI